MTEYTEAEARRRWVAAMEQLHEGDPPDGWVIEHHRAFGQTCHFGPFATLSEAADWALAHPHVNAGFVPLYLTVDWSR